MSVQVSTKDVFSLGLAQLSTLLVVLKQRAHSLCLVRTIYFPSVEQFRGRSDGDPLTGLLPAWNVSPPHTAP